MIVYAAAIGERASVADAERARFTGRTELAVIAGQPLVDRLRFARAGPGIAHAHVALIAKGGAIRGRSAACTARADISGRAEITVVASVGIVRKYTRAQDARIVGTHIRVIAIGVAQAALAHAVEWVALLALRAGYRRTGTIAGAANVGFGAEITVVARETFIGRLGLACVGGLVADAEVALIVERGAVDGGPAAAGARRASLAGRAE